ncbi:MAG TPA: MerR family transcriptional regulator [Acidisarcina sp.]|nr:MerR family transcriptional regulator [Acidisarcina sp.]
MPNQQPNRRASVKTEIPDKLYFRIGEVSRLCAVEAYVLRFWETEFSQLRPNKSGTGQRLYRKRDVEMALRIKRLLHEEGYTIAGARQILQAESRRKGGQPELPMPAMPIVLKPQDAPAGATKGQRAVPVEQMRRELRELLGILSVPPNTPETRTRNVKRFQAPAAKLFED